MILLNKILLVAANAAAETTDAATEIKEWTEKFSGLPLDKVIEKLVDEAVDFTLKLIVAAVVFYIGKLIISRVHKSVKKIMIKRKADQSLATFILSTLKVVMLFLLIIIVISILGIETSSFIALFASAGVAIGMALSGTLQNFAGGVLILLLKPYKVGDFIEFQGFTGTVKAIQIFSTKINTTDNKSVFIPNGGLSTGSINNYSEEDYRRLEWTVNIAYGNDYDAAKEAILKILSSDSRIVKQYIEDDRKLRKAEKKEASKADEEVADDSQKEPKKRFRLFRHKKKVLNRLQALNTDEDIVQLLPKVDKSPFVALGALSSSSVDVVVRAWVPTQYYWNVFYDINERIYKELPSVGIDFPFPQMDVYLKH